jgi:hypothetical protein
MRNKRFLGRQGKTIFVAAKKGKHILQAFSVQRLI